MLSDDFRFLLGNMFMRHLTKSIVLLFAFAVFTPMASVAQPVDPAKRELILKIFSDTGYHQMQMRRAQAFAANFVGKLRKNDEEFSERATAILREEVMIELRLAQRELVETSVIEYDRHFSLEELQQFSEFYATPLGRKWFQAMPEITQAEAAASRELTRRLSPAIMARVKNRYRSGDL